MTAHKREILGAVITIEEDGQALYLDAAAKAAGVNSRKMFEALAGDETRHIEWIEKFEPGVQATGEANRDLYDSGLKELMAIAETPKGSKR